MFTLLYEKLCLYKAKLDIGSCNYEKIPVFSFNGLNLWVKCVECYDGDTITVIFKYKNNIVKEKIRLYGINTPEIRTKNDDEKTKGLLSRNYLKSKILNKFIWVEFKKREKYGRSLAKIYIKPNTKSINDEMVILKYAEKYMDDK